MNERLGPPLHQAALRKCSWGKDCRGLVGRCCTAHTGVLRETRPWYFLSLHCTLCAGRAPGSWFLTWAEEDILRPWTWGGLLASSHQVAYRSKAGGQEETAGRCPSLKSHSWRWIVSFGDHLHPRGVCWHWGQRRRQVHSWLWGQHRVEAPQTAYSPGAFCPSGSTAHAENNEEARCHKQPHPGLLQG